MERDKNGTRAGQLERDFRKSLEMRHLRAGQKTGQRTGQQAGQNGTLGICGFYLFDRQALRERDKKRDTAGQNGTTTGALYRAPYVPCPDVTRKTGRRTT